MMYNELNKQIKKLTEGKGRCINKRNQILKCRSVSPPYNLPSTKKNTQIQHTKETTRDTKFK